MDMNKWERILGFCRRHIEAVLIVPAILIGLAAVGYFGWTRGEVLFDWVAAVMDAAYALLLVSGIGYLAWRFKTEYWYDLNDDEEEWLHAKVQNGDRNALWALIMDRLEFLALFVTLLLAFGRFAGASDLIVRWEVGGQSGYQRCCTGVIYPGGQSGPTWGIGYDGGQQHPDTIRRDWAHRCEVELLATASGIIGPETRAYLKRFATVRVPYSEALAVFRSRSLPRYEQLARRAYGRAFDTAPGPVREALTSEVYNRGTGMAGNTRAERRIIRDRCLPAGDWECVAAQLEASCRVWAGKPIGVGLCNRRRDEARTAREAL